MRPLNFLTIADALDLSEEERKYFVKTWPDIVEARSSQKLATIIADHAALQWQLSDELKQIIEARLVLVAEVFRRQKAKADTGVLGLLAVLAVRKQLPMQLRDLAHERSTASAGVLAEYDLKRWHATVLEIARNSMLALLRLGVF
jgi:hypothetical protein